MLYLEETVDAILAEEGQTLMGLEYMTDVLGLTMKKMELLFKKSILEYAKRRPIKETKIFNAALNSATAGTLVMPEGTIMVNAVRYGVLPNIPRFYLPRFGAMSYEYEKHNRILRVWPPIAPLKVTYTRHYTFTNNTLISENYYMEDGDDTLYESISNTFKNGTLTITKNNLTMEEIAREEKTEEINGITKTYTLVTLSGDLGSGFINLGTREMELTVEDTAAGYVYISYKPLYKVITELDLGDFVFTKLFSLKILEALASLRAQSTQEALHNIDLTTDELYSRVRLLKREVEKLLKSTTSISSMLDI